MATLPVAVLAANGAADAGQQPAGVVAQYLVDGVLGTPELGSANAGPSGVMPYDSGTILGTIPPGKPGLKLVNGTVQRASQIISTQVAGSTGNSLTPTFNALNNTPTPPAGTLPADGLSGYPGRE
jgi:hypothetical protein